jgi:Flp pilus assembly protein TadD
MAAEKARALNAIGGTVVAALLLGACAKMPAGFVASGDTNRKQEIAAADQAGGRGTPDGDRAYFSTAFAKNPRDEKAAIAYARSLKAESKEKSMGVLQQAAMYNPDSKAIASEQARLAVDLDQLDFAEKLIARAEDPARPDWRLISAKGTIAAKRGDHKTAIRHFEAAQRLAPKEASVLNNLALAYALDGQAVRAESLLKQARAVGGENEQVRQNLALVLGVQGKFDEAKTVAAADLGSESVASNSAYLKRMAKATPVVAPVQVAAKPAAAKPVLAKANLPAPTKLPAVAAAPVKKAGTVVAKAKPLLRPATEPAADGGVDAWAAAIAKSGP